VYFPKATWYALDTNKTRAGGASADITAAWDETPVYVRAGTILPLGPVIQHTDDLPGGALDLQVYPGRNASYTLTEDDGQTTAYTTGQVQRVAFTWEDATRTLNWKVDGRYRGKDIFKEMKVTLYDPTGITTGNGTLETPGKLVLPKL